MGNAVKSLAGAIGTAAVIASLVNFTPNWEGTDYVAKPDKIGTGHPITWCHGQTNNDRDAAHQVKAGTRFTKEECDKELAESMEKIYLPEVASCLKRPMPADMVASFVDGAYNAGSRRVCNSPMVAKANAGDFRAACEAFDGWIIRSDGVVRPGLIDRRSGELHGDHRKSERALCLEGVNNPNEVMFSYTGEVAEPKTGPYMPPGAVAKPTVVHKKHILKPHVVVCTGFLWTRECK